MPCLCQKHKQGIFLFLTVQNEAVVQNAVLFLALRHKAQVTKPRLAVTRDRT